MTKTKDYISDEDRVLIALELNACLQETGGYTLSSEELTDLIGRIAKVDDTYTRVASVLIQYDWLDATSMYDSDTRTVIRNIINAVRETDD